jgi:hypothetical protein
VTGAAPGPSAPPPSASPASPKIYSFFCIAGPQYREIQRLPQVEVWYDSASEQYFKGGWSEFVDDHDIQRGFFMNFDFHIGTSKFDVRIYDVTQCQKEYEAEVHFH